jgi:hypothetical protein
MDCFETKRTRAKSSRPQWRLQRMFQSVLFEQVV